MNRRVVVSSAVAAVIALVVFLVWAWRSGHLNPHSGPVEAFNTLATAAQAGDVEAFLQHLTPDSRAAMHLVLSNREKYPKILALGGAKVVAYKYQMMGDDVAREDEARGVEAMGRCASIACRRIPRETRCPIDIFATLRACAVSASGPSRRRWWDGTTWSG